MPAERTAAPSTVDTNILVYAMGREVKTATAADAVGRAAFLSAQVLNEYANVASRKIGRSWPDIAGDLRAIRQATPYVLPLTEESNADGARIAGRYKLAFYDSLMLAVALAGGARIIYSEDMQSGLVIDDVLRIVNPYTAETA